MPRHRPTARPQKNHSEDRETSVSPSPSKNPRKSSSSSTTKTTSHTNGESKRRTNGTHSNSRGTSKINHKVKDIADVEMSDSTVPVKREKSKAPIKNGKRSHPTTSIKSPRSNPQPIKDKTGTVKSSKITVKSENKKKPPTVKPEPGTVRLNRNGKTATGGSGKSSNNIINKTRDMRRINGGIGKSPHRPTRKTNLFPKFVITSLLTSQGDGPQFNKSAESLVLYTKNLDLQLSELIRQSLICTAACGRVTLSSDDVCCGIQATI